MSGPRVVYCQTLWDIFDLRCNAVRLIEISNRFSALCIFPSMQGKLLYRREASWESCIFVSPICEFEMIH